LYFADKIGGEKLGIRRDILRSQIYQESNDLFNRMYFSCKQLKFLHNIDTFYYTVSLENDYDGNTNVEPLLDELSAKRDEYKEKREIILLNDKLYVTSGTFDFIYGFKVTCPDKYDIFIASYLPNKDTPRIVVQLRSQALWIDGVKCTIEDSFYQMKKLLDFYHLNVSKVYENRIDYCYHTNYIQNMYKFFSDKNVDNHLRGNLTHWRKEGEIIDHAFTLDYFALGKRESNNVFVRIYNKIREVIEMNYKGFFIEIWFQEGLISAYDKYVYEFAYTKGNYNSIFEGMLHFYLEYGMDPLHKKEIQHYLKDTDNNFYKIRELALALMPEPTIICNIEFQTKRKFYYYSDDFINDFSQKLNTAALSRLMKIIDNRKTFLNYITNYNLRFIEADGGYCSWWERLRNIKMDTVDSLRPYARQYQMNIDIRKIKKRTINSIVSHSVYNLDTDTSFMDDITDFICSLNDNDIQRGNVGFINYLGEVIENVNSEFLDDYKEKKEKKYKTIKNRLIPKETD
jgi:hypothetical protein